MSTELVQYGVSDLVVMAKAMANSKLFGVSNVDQALALMLVAQAEGYHPALAARDYHIIQGRPTLKADTMLTRFQKAGGTVQWTVYTDERVEGIFSHPAGGTLTVDWDMARAKQAQVGGKDMWQKYPRQMLRARVISEAVRSLYPGVSASTYTPEEIEDSVQEKHTKKEELINVTPPLEQYTYEEVYEQIKNATNLPELDKGAQMARTLWGKDLEEIKEYGKLRREELNQNPA